MVDLPREHGELELKDSLDLLEGETEAGLIGQLHTGVPKCPQEGTVDPFSSMDRMKEGCVLLLTGIEISQPLETEQGEPP